MVASQTPHRFAALDALRGICALLVALFHFKTTGYITNSAFIREAWLFVDFFFVLSGFVIASAYGGRLAQGFRVRDFLLLRAGRIYPLHCAVLLVFVLFEAAKPLLGDTGLSAQAPFASPRSPAELLASLSLTQFLAFPSYLTWNTPSWSIAVEMWTYLLAAILFAKAGRGALPIVVVVVLCAFGALLWNGVPFLNHTSSALALLRCVLGFGLGVIGWHVFTTRLAQKRAGFAVASLLELATLGLVCGLVLVSKGGVLTLAAPPLFVLCVLVFAGEGGALSMLLRTRPLLLLGALSYSIYLTHVFVESRLIDLAALASQVWGVNLATVEIGASGVSKLLGPVENPLLGDAMAFVGLVAIVLVSWISYALVEEPFRRWSRRRVDAFGAN